MSSKYEPLRSYLDEAADDEAVSLTFAELDVLVGGLPPSAMDRTWWANTTNRTRVQAQAWLGVGRRVTEVRLGEAVVFSPVDAVADQSRGLATPGRQRPRQRPVLDGVRALADVLNRAGYGSIAEAVAAHTVFLHPDTVGQAGTAAIFPVVRDPSRRGEFGVLPSGVEVMFDDNSTPKAAFLWAAERVAGADVQYNHVWGDPRNPHTYSALWNLCATPAFLAKTTDGSNHPEVLSLLRYRAYELFGRWPPAEQRPDRPSGYCGLTWHEPPDPVSNLESVFRGRLAAAPKSRPAAVARRLGWVFSEWRPDARIE